MRFQTSKIGSKFEWIVFAEPVTYTVYNLDTHNNMYLSNCLHVATNHVHTCVYLHLGTISGSASEEINGIAPKVC